MKKKLGATRYFNILLVGFVIFFCFLSIIVNKKQRMDLKSDAKDTYMISLSSSTKDFDYSQYSSQPTPLAPYIKDNFEEVIDFCRISESKATIKSKDQINNDRIHYVDSSFFNMFRSELKDVNINSSNSPNVFFLSKNYQEQLLHNDLENNSNITIEDSDVIFKDFKFGGAFDRSNRLSLFNFDCILPYDNLIDKGYDIESWKDWTTAAFVCLAPTVQISEFERKLQSVVSKVNSSNPKSHFSGIKLISVSEIPSCSRVIRGNIYRNFFFTIKQISLLLIIFIICILAINNVRVRNKILLHTGWITVVTFWITTLIAGFILGDYNHLSDAVSHLGELGSKAETYFSVFMIICSLLIVTFLKGVFQIHRINCFNLLPIFIILTLSVSLFGIAVFPAGLKMHTIAGSPALLFILSPITSLIVWRKDAHLKPLRTPAVLSIASMLIAILLSMPDFMQEYSGVTQRFTHISWSIWMIALSTRYMKIDKILTLQP